MTRAGMAVELHDGAMQELTLARLQLDLLRATVEHDVVLADDLVSLSDLLGEASERLHELMRRLSGNVMEVI